LRVRFDALIDVTVMVKQKKELVGTTTSAEGENEPVLRPVPMPRVVEVWAIVVGLVQVLAALKAKFNVTPVVFPTRPVVE
jgi:hypothetical protein